MKKIFTVFTIFFLLKSSAFCQVNPATATLQETINTEVKAALLSKLKLSNAMADKVVVIEKEFHTQLSAINALGDITIKDREVKLNAAHVNRRKQLMDGPLSGREMEDVIYVTDAVYRKYKM